MSIQPTVPEHRRWHLSLSFQAERASPFFDERAWGARYTSALAVPESVYSEAQVLPEGILLALECSVCARRQELVADFRGLSELLMGASYPPVDFARFGLEHCRGVEGVLLARSAEGWASRHQECQTTAAPEPPASLRIAAEALRQEATRTLQEEGFIAPSVHLSTSRGDLWSFDGDGENARTRALWSFRVREALRQRRTEPAWLILAEECAGVEPGERVWRLAARLGEESWLAEAELDRFDRPMPSPGRLGALRWSPGWGEHEGLAGFHTTRLPFPLPREGGNVVWSAER